MGIDFSKLKKIAPQPAKPPKRVIPFAPSIDHSKQSIPTAPSTLFKKVTPVTKTVFSAEKGQFQQIVDAGFAPPKMTQPVSNNPNKGNTDNFTDPSLIKSDVAPKPIATTANQVLQSYQNVKEIREISENTAEAPSLIMVTKFQPLLKSSLHTLLSNKVSNTLFQEETIYNFLTNSGKYFDLQIQSRYIDYLGYRYLFNHFNESTKSVIRGNNSDLLNLITELNTFLSEIFDVYQKIDDVRNSFSINEKTKNYLKSIGFDGGNIDLYKNWNDTKFFVQTLSLLKGFFLNPSLILDSLTESSIFKSADVVNSFMFDEKYIYSKYFTDFVKDQNLFQPLDLKSEIVSIINRYYSLFSYISDYKKPYFNNSFNTNINDSFSYLSHELSYSIKGLTVDDLNKKIGIPEYVGFFNLQDILNSTDQPIGCVKMVGFDDQNIVGQYNILSYENNELLDSNENVIRPVVDAYVIDTINNFLDNGNLSKTNFNKLKSTVNETLDNLNFLKQKFDFESSLDPSLWDYIYDPINLLIKSLSEDLTSTYQKINWNKNKLSQDLNNVHTIAYIKCVYRLAESESRPDFLLGLFDVVLDFTINGTSNNDFFNKKMKRYHEFLETKITPNQFSVSGNAGEPKRPKEVTYWISKDEDSDTIIKNSNKLFHMPDQFSGSSTFKLLISSMQQLIEILNVACVDNKTKFSGITNTAVLYFFFDLMLKIIMTAPVETRKIDHATDDSRKRQFVKITDKVKGLNVYGTESKKFVLSKSNLEKNQLLPIVPQKFLKFLISIIDNHKTVLNNFDKYVLENDLKGIKDFYRDIDNNDLKNLFGLTITQLNSFKSRINDLEINLKSESNGENQFIKELDGAIITSTSVKTLVCNTLSKFDKADILSIGLPAKQPIDKRLNLQEGKNLIVLNVIRQNEIKLSNDQTEFKFIFDMNLFPVAAYSMFQENDLSLRNFSDLVESVFTTLDQNQYKNIVRQDDKNELIYNHKLSFILEIYLSIFTGLQLNEKSFITEKNYDLLNQLKISSACIRAINTDPISREIGIQYHIESLKGIISNLSDRKLIKKLILSPNTFDRVFNVIIPLKDESIQVNEYQIFTSDYNSTTGDQNSNMSPIPMRPPGAAFI